MELIQSDVGKLQFFGGTSSFISFYSIGEPSLILNNKFIMFYRKGDGAVAGPYAYYLLSGNSKPSPISLVCGTGDGDAYGGPAYGYSWTDPILNKIWFSWTWREPGGSLYGDDCALYAYKASLQSWKSGVYPAGYDFWHYPNGTFAGSGASGGFVQQNNGATKISYLTCSANRAGPYASGTLITDKFDASSYSKMTTMANGELACYTNTGNPTNPQTANSSIEVWYLSSNGNWIRTLSMPSSSISPADPLWAFEVASFCGGVLIPTISGLALIKDSGDKVIVRLSDDFARTWTNDILLADLTGLDWTYGFYKQIMPKVSYDKYARVFCLKTNAYLGDHCGSHTFIKFNTDGNVVSESQIIGVIASGSGWIEMISPGVFHNNVNYWSAPRTKTGDTATGDPRWIYWYNESTTATGNKMAAPDGTSTVDRDTHNACCVRVDDQGVIWVIGACYFGGATHVLAPDMVSSNSLDNAFNIQFDDIDTTSGYVGCSFEVFRE